MEMNVQVPFQQLLKLIEKLTPAQKGEIRKALDKAETGSSQKNAFMDFLLQGPVYSEEDIAVIQENRESIAAWRTKNS